ncbi:MAG: hypothetical protein P1U42_11950 [Phycisphaerales bacterium]|nr:hypothetical protein [Phycisphaerales bacterium]
MKLKGVNPIEQHIEKIVLAVVLIVLLAVLSMQFVLRPNDVDVGNRKVSPDQVYSVLETQATQLQSQLSDLNPQLPELESVDLVERYNNAFASSSGGAVALSTPLGKGVDISYATGGQAPTGVEVNTGPVAGLIVPKTDTPIALSHWATLDPYAVLEVPAYETYIPSAQPFDFASVSVQANFSGKDLEAALLGKSGGEGAIPRRFWSTTGLAIMGFEAQREQLMADGSWGNAEPIETPPHTPLPINALGKNAGLLDLTDLVTKANRARGEVVNPMFPPTIAGGLWVPPSDRVDTGDDSEATMITRIQRRLDRYRVELDRLNNAPAGGGARPTGTRPGGPKTGRPGGNPTQPATNPRNNSSRIDKLRKDIEDLEKQLKDLGVDDSQSSRRARTSRDDVGSVLEEESVELWAHDLGVEPGATYRYRTRVVVNNPLFRKGGELDPDDAAQQALTQEPFVRGDWSDWSDRVVVGAETYFFVTNADADNGIGTGGAKASIELYQMYYGNYRRSSLTAYAGDELSASVRMSGDLLNFDSSIISASDAAKAVGELNIEDSVLPEGITELSNRISIELGVYILDIYADLSSSETSFGQSVTPMNVVLRDQSGAVIVRSDLRDESSAAYELASESASSASSTPLREPGVSAIPPASLLFQVPGP